MTVHDPDWGDLGTMAETAWRQVDAGESQLVPTADAVVRADETHLQQLLANLFRNAVEYGNGDVTVTIGDTTDGFFVVDDGTGIDPPRRDYVFESGYTKASGGTGLGLAIVAQIAGALDWHITLSDGSTGGTRFEIAGIEIK